VSMKLLSNKLIRNCGQHSSVIRPFLCQENFNRANFFKTHQSPTVILQKTYQSFYMLSPDGRKLAHWIRGNLLYPFKATRVLRNHSLIFQKSGTFPFGQSRRDFISLPSSDCRKQTGGNTRRTVCTPRDEGLQKLREAVQNPK
jgi:hypothetical protein